MSNDQDKKTKALPVLAVRDAVVYPGQVTPFHIGRDESKQAVTEAEENHDDKIIIVAQRDGKNDEPDSDALYDVGTVCTIAQTLNAPDGTVKILIQGEYKVKISEFSKDQGFFSAHVVEIPEQSDDADEELQARAADALEAFEKYAKIAPNVDQEMIKEAKSLKDQPTRLSYAIASQLVNDTDAEMKSKQELLEMQDTLERLTGTIDYMVGQYAAVDVAKTIKKSVKKNMEKTQREYYLNEQMKAIKQELGEDSEDELEELKNLIDEAGMPEKVEAKARKELKKLMNTNPQSAEATVIRNYLDALLEYPWSKSSEINYDLDAAREGLDEDHYGLDKVKEQVIENLAVQARLEEKGLTQDAEPDILCLVGPPGVGKTSICKSLAKSTGREYVRYSVGGVKEESEIRGHRRTYIGSKPGKIVQKMTEAGTNNPLFVIDEIDKMGSDQRGDPSAAMLEVLDPEQNDTFEDHYLEVPTDLSKVKFVCTANVWGKIPTPLQDRMETIFLGSYTEDEKLEIAKQHLVRKQRKAHGLEENELQIDENALRDLVRYYTKESGVRNLQREIKKICRKAVVELQGDNDQVTITSENLEDYAGKRAHKYNLVEDAEDKVGVVSGLAYTSVGGETLKIEASKIPSGKGIVSQSGKLGDVMKESITAATVLIKSKAESIGVDIDKQVLPYDFHVHVPEGAVPKDGPSAGVGMLTALFSEITGKKVRKDVAMTGEITTKGEVTAIGGLREKLSAAARAGYKTVLIPEENVKNLDEVPDSVLEVLEVKPVSTIEEVLETALVDGSKLFKDGQHIAPPESKDPGSAQPSPQ